MPRRVSTFFHNIPRPFRPYPALPPRFGLPVLNCADPLFLNHTLKSLKNMIFHITNVPCKNALGALKVARGDAVIDIAVVGIGFFH